MLKFIKEKVTSYPPELIYQIVLDIETYPLFIPWCVKAKIITKVDDKIIADLSFRYGIVDESYRSEVSYELKDDNYFIQAKGIPGPFKHLLNLWQITPNSIGCSIKFMLEVELKTKLMQTMLKSFYSIAAEKMINAFESRAKELSLN